MIIAPGKQKAAGSFRWREMTYIVLSVSSVRDMDDRWLPGSVAHFFSETERPGCGSVCGAAGQFDGRTSGCRRIVVAETDTGWNCGIGQGSGPFSFVESEADS